MFRRAYDALAHLLGRPRSGVPAADPMDFAREVRAPDPYVWRLPNPHDARWRRWARCNRAAGFRLPIPRDEECWRIATHPGAPPWEATDDVVRPYVVKR
ncbi:hypothetical protein [Streptomyces alanosinicus]|uniref:Uncharacterized protein n=1 Tax=Streptomyces alanosinicus TaxID=68171 RepID=A0A918YFM7_9ACTN|nr:hypothetical protein [Streptomyces alanosinicus]GHE00246.1 hypothetical protein GCM10010339_14650 [Streptomyces alanosinicus]